MKTLKESLLSDINTTLDNFDFGRSVPKIIELLNDPLSAHYSSYSPNEFIDGVKRKDNVCYIVTPENKQKWCGKYKTPTDLWKDTGQPAWETLYKLAKNNLKSVDYKVAKSKDNPLGDFIVFIRPTKTNSFWRAKILDIAIFRKNTKINKSYPYLELHFYCDTTLSYVCYNADRKPSISIPMNGWNVEIFDINSNPHWFGLIEEVFEKFPSYKYNENTDKLLKCYPANFTKIK